MDQLLRKLTLIYPPTVEDHIVDLLVNAEPPLAGFTTWKADGHGQDFSMASVRERVRGRAARGVLAVVLPRSRLGTVLEEIRSRVGTPDLTYWIEPVESIGRLARVDADSAPVAA
ncbi:MULTISPECIES: DUF3240 family protein [Hyphomicrobium]|uniref:Nitrogen regulatory protein P-II n=1 Tax=Hyphomicrobium nitrativorans NL23 TaxID=1029756 RepID=V5SCT7_9HYPH|nr:DUF3240 family protein [Hyphomicrobium nitrativorans]AHB47850.1 hypothetical protein W911_04655 [Hyphomicrobium nitrativorans NL23]